MITGSIIRILLNNGINPEELCLTESDRVLYSKFPRSKDHDMDWVLAFEEFVDELVMANILIKQYVTLFLPLRFSLIVSRTSDVLYAFGLDAGELQYNSVDDPAILVTVNRDLTIVVSASPTGPAIYVDVPLENIIHTKIVSVWNDESQAHRYAVTIELSQIVGGYWYHNAVGQNGSTMSIAFTSQSHAEVLSELCRQSEKAWLTTRAPVMESQPIDCSETGLHGQLARPNLNSQRLAEMALEAHLILGQDSSTGMLHNNNAVLTSTFQDRITEQIPEPGTVAESHEDPQRLANSMASAMEGIDVSQQDTTNCGKADSNIQNSSAHTDGPAIEVPRTIAISADVEFDASPRHANESTIQQGQLSKSEDQGYDSSYDISPRASRVQSKISDDAVPVIQLDPLHPPGGNRILPVTGDGSTERPPLAKLSRSLRNNNGSVEVGVESPPSLGLERASKGKGREDIKDEYDLPTSPEQQVRKSKASMTQDKSTSQAPDRVIPQKSKSQKSAKTTIPPSSLPPRRLEVHPEHERNPKAPPEKAVRPPEPAVNEDAGGGSIRKTGLDNSNEDCDTSPKQKKKAINVAKNPLRQPKEAKPSRAEPQPKNIVSRASGVRKAKAKPVADLSKTRSRRPAALIANKKIQGLEAFNEIGDEAEKLVSISRRKPATTTEEQDIQQSLTAIPEEQVLRNTDRGQASVSGNAKNRMVPPKDTVPSSRPDEDATSEASSVENVELVSATTRQGVAQAGTTSESSLPPPNPDLLVAQGTSSYGGIERQAVGMDLNDDIEDRAPEAQNREKDFIPDSITKGFDVVSEVEEESVIEPDLEIDEEVRPLSMVGDAEDSHFQEAMPDRGLIGRREEGTIDHETPGPGNVRATREMEGHMAMEEAHDTSRTTQHANQASIKSDKSTIISRFPKARDPFEKKLNLLTPDNEATTPDVRKSAGPYTKQKFKASKQHQADEGETVTSAEQVNDRRHVTQPETRGDVGTIQHQKNGSLNNKSDLNKERQVQPQPQKAREPMKQSVQAEQQQNVGHIRSQQAILEPNVPRLPVPEVENKRKALRDGGVREKRPKLAQSNEQKPALHGISERLQQAMGKTTSMSGHGMPTKTSSAEVQVPDINRKPEIISFSAAGAQNQGSASIKKPKLRIVTKMEADDNIKAAPRKERETLKRKPTHSVDDPAPPAYEQPSKRQKPDITPPTNHTHIAQMFPEPNAIIAEDKPHKVSSQSTRVNENGSPMPSVHALNQRIADTQEYPEAEVPVNPYLRTGFHTGNAQGGNYAEGADRMLPRNQIPPPQKWHIAGFEKLSSNSKRKCDSPNAPSSFTSVPAHYVFHDGTLVNAQTRENIIPTKPQDPFVGAGQAGTSDFMLALRRTSGTEARNEDALLSEKKPGMNAKRGLPATNEDPDKTLVEGQPPKEQRNHDIISISSTTTSSSSGSVASEGLSPPIESSSGEGDADILEQWRKALQPHQRLMVSVLSDISQVSNAIRRMHRRY